MKNIYIVGGTMGVGKTSACKILKNRLDRSVFLDGDWCWDMHPFTVTDETKKMVEDNICHTLNNFLGCSEFQNVIFCWVMHEQAIVDGILEKLHCEGWNVHKISLVCDEKSLIKRLKRDIELGIRTQDAVARSTERLSLYDKLDTVKIDVSHITAQEAAEKIASL